MSLGREEGTDPAADGAVGENRDESATVAGKAVCGGTLADLVVEAWLWGPAKL